MLVWMLMVLCKVRKESEIWKIIWSNFVLYLCIVYNICVNICINICRDVLEIVWLW